MVIKLYKTFLIVACTISVAISYPATNNADYEETALLAIKDTCDTIGSITDFAQNNFFNAIALIIAATYSRITNERLCGFFGPPVSTRTTNTLFG